MDTRKLRDDIAADYKRNYERLGVRDVPFEAFQKLAASDLEIVDKDESTPSAPSKAKPSTLVQEKEPAGEPEKAAQLADNVGGKFYRRAIVDAPTRKAVKSGPIQQIIGERGAKLSLRFAQILEIDHKAAAGKRNVAIMDKPYKYPALAKDALQEHADYTMLRRGYRGLSEVDRNRRFLRKIEDICDRSTGVLGPWWVK